MTNIQRVRVPVTTDASGAFTAETPEVTGRILSIRYVPADSNDLDANWDLDIVGKNTGIVVANIDNISAAAITWAPRQPTCDVAGAASLFAAGGEPIEDYIWVREALTVTIAQGGNVQSGAIFITVG